ncbi:MAG: SRPBCC family protein [Treponema sp.]|jgi:hypothetical protein|nr:SRPBCC family protein [Treponema sp.]
MIYKRILKRGLFLVSVFLVPALGASADAGIAPNTDFKKIYNRSTIISSRVTSYKDSGNNTWITMFADTHVTTDIPLARLRYIITDYLNYPRYFKRNTSSRIAGTTEDGGVYQDVRVTVGLLGLSFSGRYTVLVREMVDTPEKFVLTFNHINDDGNIRDVNGEWYFERVTVDGQLMTYVRYVSSSSSLRRIGIQKAIQTMFVSAEFTDMTDQLLAAGAR